MENTKQQQIDTIYKILEPLLDLRETIREKLEWCMDGIRTFEKEKIAEERVIELKSFKDALFFVNDVLDAKIESLENELKTV